MLTIAHVSDLHIDGGARATERAERVLGYLRSAPGPLDVVVVTGDIADHGLPDEYEEVRRLIDLPCPVLVAPGNHDVRPAFASGLLAAPPTEQEINRAERVAGATFLLCDSTVPGEAGGRLSDATLDWLDDTLRTTGPQEPAFICFHHPPVDLHVPYIDNIRQRGEERLAAVLGRHPRVVAVLCGHAHTAATTTFAGVPVCVAPAVVSTVPLPLEGRPVVDHELPPAVAFHVLDDQHRLVTHHRALP